MQSTTYLMLGMEYVTPLLLIACFSFGFALKRPFLKALLFGAAIVQLAVLSFRPEDYNSDTWNYSKYLALLSDTSGMDLFFVSKFDPFHLALASLAGDFRICLVLEGFVCLLLVFGILRLLTRLESVAIILGSALPLFSSSLRFSVVLLAVAYAAAAYRRAGGRLAVLSAVGLSTHVSLTIAGLFQRKYLWTIGLLLIAFFFYAQS